MRETSVALRIVNDVSYVRRIKQSSHFALQVQHRAKFKRHFVDSEDSSGSQSASTVEAEDIESDLESLEEHYYSNLRQYSATLERDFPAHYTTQQLNTQEWDFDAW